MKKIVVALAGNPNCGKTTLFNAFTGARQHVGNYPGVTVERKEGQCSFEGYDITFVDLPGTYSLTAYSEEELVTRQYLLDEAPDVVVDVVDASNVERHLYLGTQLIEMNVPLVLAFNMSDVAERKGLVFDLGELSTLMGAEIVSTVGSKRQGIEALLKAIVARATRTDRHEPRTIQYGQEIEHEMEALQAMVAQKQPALLDRFEARWLAIKLLEQDRDILEAVTDSAVLEGVDRSVEHLKGLFNDLPEIVVADRRYGFISGACQQTIKNTVELRHSTSDLIDTVVTHRVLGLPIFMLLMYIVFWLTFTLGEKPMEGLDWLFGWLGGAVAGLWPQGSESLIKSLLVDGVIGGVGGVIVFLPNILLLFLAIALLEDTGYMARAAFVMDRLMHKIGLHGKSFIPMLIGFGCTVPAIMAARILENRRNRLTTIMVLPLMSCGARLTIYGLLIPAFFPKAWQGPVLWIVYLTGIVLAVVLAKVLRLSILKGETMPFVMELPPYRLPTFRSLAIHMWHRAWMFLKKAGTVILGISIVLWVLATFPRTSPGAVAGLGDVDAQKYRLEHSVMGAMGKAIEPVIRPLGFDWKIGTALIGATAAKEVFVSQLGIVYAVEDEQEGVSLRVKLKETYTPLVGLCVMLFCLISAPCVATIAMTRQETGSWGCAAAQFAGLTVLAYGVTLIVFQAGRVLGF
ncbi:MAG: ferrous iron transport protein B [Planctomycetes bacterium]|nr:ferrous iron transport protein B [Planctomycetota bacterium]